jgi:hypothetical protein
MLVILGAVVEPETVIEVTPVAFKSDRVAAALAETVTLSIDDKVGEMIDPLARVALKESAPAPPVKTSEELSVCAPVELRAPSKESAPDLPVKVFALVVSDLWQVRNFSI